MFCFIFSANVCVCMCLYETFAIIVHKRMQPPCLRQSYEIYFCCFIYMSAIFSFLIVFALIFCFFLVFFLHKKLNATSMCQLFFCFFFILFLLYFRLSAFISTHICIFVSSTAYIIYTFHSFKTKKRVAKISTDQWIYTYTYFNGLNKNYFFGIVYLSNLCCNAITKTAQNQKKIVLFFLFRRMLLIFLSLTNTHIHIQ